MSKSPRKPSFGPTDGDAAWPDHLAGFDPTDPVYQFTRAHQMMARLDALKVKYLLKLFHEHIDPLTGLGVMSLRGALMQLSKTTGVSDRTLQKQVGIAYSLHNTLGNVLDALTRGLVSYRVAEAITIEAAGLTDFFACPTCRPATRNVFDFAQCTCGYEKQQKTMRVQAVKTYEARMLREAARPGMSPTKITGIAKRVCESLRPTPVEERQAECLVDAQFYGFKQTPVNDGVVETSFVTDPVTAVAIGSRVHKIARLKQLQLKEEAQAAAATAANADVSADAGAASAVGVASGEAVAVDDDAPSTGIPSLGQLQCETAAEILLGTLDAGYRQVAGEVKITIPALTLETGASRHTLEQIQHRVRQLLQQGNSSGSSSSGAGSSSAKASARKFAGSSGAGSSTHKAATIIGLSGHAVLDGYGPVAAGPPPDGTSRVAVVTSFADSMFNTVLLNSSWSRIYVDPLKGTPLTTDSYQPTAAMRRILETRDVNCRFTGCGVKAVRTDADHTIPWQQNDAEKQESGQQESGQQENDSGGLTEIPNLSLLCRRHHMDKHHSGWGLKQLGDGVLEWTAPSGRKYVDHPDYGYPQPPEPAPPKQPEHDDAADDTETEGAEIDDTPPPF